MSEISSQEIGLLELVRDAGEPVSWYYLGKRAAALGDPAPDVTSLLKSLEERGLLRRVPGKGKTDAWELTGAARAVLGEEPAPGAPPGPLSAGELAALVKALKRDAVTSATALVPLIADGKRLREALLQVVALDPLGNALAASRASLFLRAPDLAAFAAGMLDDPRPEVRAALFQAWCPPKNDVPGQAVQTLTAPELDDIVRRGLLDSSRAVRAGAAAAVFASGRGDRSMGELMANLEAPERELRWWTILALGGARDAVSLEALEQIAGEPDMAAAAAAVRALAARPDGHPAWFEVLAGPDGELRRAALFALAEVARNVDPGLRALLERDDREDTRQALSRYYSRAETVS